MRFQSLVTITFTFLFSHFIVAQNDNEFNFDFQTPKNHKIGLKVGLTNGNIDFDDDNFNSGKATGMYFNVSYEHPLYEDYVSSEIMLDYLEINGDEFTHLPNFEEQVGQKIKLNYVSIGFKPRIYLVPELTGKLKFYVYGGIYGSYLINSSIEESDTSTIKRLGIHRTNGLGAVIKFSEKSQIELEWGTSKSFADNGKIEGYDIRTESQIFSIGYKIALH